MEQSDSTYYDLNNRNKGGIEKKTYCLVSDDILQNLNPKEISKILNSDQKFHAKAYNVKKPISDEVVTIFIKGLKYFINQGGEIVFTGLFDMDLSEYLSGNVTDIEIIGSNVKGSNVKVTFVLDDGTIKTDEVLLQDAFCSDFSFHCNPPL